MGWLLVGRGRLVHVYSCLVIMYSDYHIRWLVVLVRVRYCSNAQLMVRTRPIALLADLYAPPQKLENFWLSSATAESFLVTSIFILVNASAEITHGLLYLGGPRATI